MQTPQTPTKDTDASAANKARSLRPTRRFTVQAAQHSFRAHVASRTAKLGPSSFSSKDPASANRLPDRSSLILPSFFRLTVSRLGRTHSQPFLPTSLRQPLPKLTQVGEWYRCQASARLMADKCSVKAPGSNPGSPPWNAFFFYRAGRRCDGSISRRYSQE